MASLRRSQTMSPTTDIATRKLPELPPEAYNESTLSRFWATVKSKLSISPRRSTLRRSHSVIPDTAAGKKKSDSRNSELPYSIYNQLINNHENMVLPGLRQYPPPIEDDESTRIGSATLPQVSGNRHHDYDAIEIYEGQYAAGPGANALALPNPDLPEPNPPINEYQDIDDLLKKRTSASPMRVFPGRRQKQPKMAALASSINNLHHQGWYWGPLNREETEAKLQPLESGSFLVRDSTDAHHLYTLSFKQERLILHTRIEFVNGLFTFFLSEERAKDNGKASVEELIISSMVNGVKGEFGDSRRVRRPGQSSIKIILTHPVSRFNDVRSLQFLCKFVLRANMNRDNVPSLPLPKHVKTWVHEKDYF